MNNRLLETIAVALVSAGLGAAATLIRVTVRIALLEARVQRDEADLHALGERIDERLDRMDRRGSVLLDMVANVARAVHVDRRWVDDAVQRYVTEDITPKG